MDARAGGRLAALDTIALGQTVLVAVLLATQFVPQPHISSGVSAQGGLPYAVPLASFLVMTVSLVAGYCLLLAGALRSPWPTRFLVLAVVTGVLAIRPITTLAAGGTGSGHQLQRWLSVAQLVVLATFWLWAGAIAARERRAPAGGNGQAAGRPPVGGAFLRVLALLLAYYGLAAGIWLAFVQAGHAGAGAGIVRYSIGTEVLFVSLVLVFPILAFSTDWVNRAQEAVRNVLFLRQGGRGKLRFSGSLPVLTAGLAAGLLAYELWRPHRGLLAGLVAVIILAGIAALLVRIARVDRRWPLRVGRRWVFAAAAFIFVDVSLIVDLNPFPPGFPSLVVSTAASLLVVPIALAALTLALFLIMKGRAGETEQGTGGLLLALAALTVLVVSYPAALASAGLSTPQPADILGAVIICAAAGTLAWLALSLRRGTWGNQTVRLRHTFALLAGLLIVQAGYAFLQLMSRLGPGYIVLLAALFLLPPLWDYLLPIAQRRLAPPRRAGAPGHWQLLRILRSPENEGQEQTPPSAEASRLLLTGYVLIANCLFLYLGTFRAPVSGAELPPFLRSDLSASAGLLLLAPPLVVLGFILRIRHPLSRGTPAADGPTRVADRSSRRRTVAIAAAVTAALSAALLVAAFPRTVRANENQSYTAAVPGASCDDGAAYWALTRPEPLGIDCLHNGLELTVPGRHTNVMTFIPPNGDFVENYRASVQVDFTRLARGCVTIETRATAAGYYWNNVCDTGTWEISRYTGSSAAMLAFGAVAPARTYQVAVTADGGNERLAVDGRQVASVSDPRFTGTQHVGLGVQNLTDRPGVAVISHFAFVPLGQPTRASTTQPYLAARPGPACDQGAAQWAVMTSKYTSIACQAGGTALAVQARHLGQLGFTPPAGIFPPGYRISVRAALNQLPDDCAIIGMHMAGTHGYLDAVCSGGLWYILRENGRTSVLLAHGTVMREKTYELQATTDGAGQSLAIDGVQVARVPNPPSASTAFVLLGVGNTGGQPGAAVFSDFAFTPLS